jgi:hypothetical protein
MGSAVTVAALNQFGDGRREHRRGRLKGHQKTGDYPGGRLQW